MQKGSYEDLKRIVEEPEENKISVIVSVYNIEQYIARCIESLLNQTYGNLQILLVDDGATDRSGSICDIYAEKDARIQVIHKKNGGLSSARNAGIREATGKYIAFVDGDDWVEREMYEHMLLALQTYGADLAACNYKRVSETGVTDGSKDLVAVFEGNEALESFIYEEEEYQFQNAAWNKVYKTSLLKEVELKNGEFFPEGKLYEDIVYTTRLLARAGRCVYLGGAYYNYVTDRKDSIMNSQEQERLLTDQIPAYEEKREFLLSIGRGDLADCHQFFFYKRMLNHYLAAKRQKEAGYQEFCKGIEKAIGRRKYICWEAYESAVGNGKDKKKLELFLLSPWLFTIFMRINDNYVIPYKQHRSLKEKEMIIIRMSGGLGNQMFEYALYLFYKSRGILVKMDDVTEYRLDNARPIQLHVFGIRYDRATPEEIREWTDSYMDIFSRVRRKLLGRKTRAYKEKSQRFDPQVLALKNAYLEGYWQSEKYFYPVVEEVRKAFVFRQELLNTKSREYLQQIQNTTSVSLHIRRGDYLQEEKVYGNICTEKYYTEAMDYMREQVKGCQFFLFTNDVAWAEQHMQGEDITIIEGSKENNGYMDMYLMSQCRHNIIANSSFSWWGAWLNGNPDKKVIAPAQWANGRDCRDVYWADMLVISGGL